MAGGADLSAFAGLAKAAYVESTAAAFIICDHNGRPDGDDYVDRTQPHR